MRISKVVIALALLTLIHYSPMAMAHEDSSLLADEQGVALELDQVIFVSDGGGIDAPMVTTHLRIKITGDAIVHIADVPISSDRMQMRLHLDEGTYTVGVLAYAQPLPGTPGGVIAAGQATEITVISGEYSTATLELEPIAVYTEVNETLIACKPFRVSAEVRSIFDVEHATFDALVYRTSRILLYGNDRSPISLESDHGVTYVGFEPVAPCSGVDRIWYWITFFIDDRWNGSGMVPLRLGAPHPPGSAYITKSDVGHL